MVKSPSSSRERKNPARGILWALLVPRRRGRVRVTSSGAGLLAFIAVTGAAAYVLGSTALFMSFAVLTSVPVMNAAMSWANARRVVCRLGAAYAMRAGSEQLVSVEFFCTGNAFGARALRACVRSKNGGSEWLWVGNVERGKTVRVEWRVKLARRGVKRLEVVAISSAFPFGFFEKIVAVRCDDAKREIFVWPAAVAYRRTGKGFAHAAQGRRVNENTDLLALRGYRAGDSQRRIHWKASARARRLVVREFAAEKEAGDVVLWVRTDAALWKGREEQFEKMCSLAATLAEDLLVAGKLAAVAVDGDWRRSVRSRADVEFFLDALAGLTLECGGRGGVLPRHVPPHSKVVLFAPEGTGGVIAHADGETVASA